MKSELNALCSYAKEKIAVSELTKRNYISTENMAPNRGGVAEAATLPTTEFTQRYRRGDVLVSNIRPYFKKIWLAKEEGGCSNDVLVFRAADVCEPAFLYYVLADDAFFDYSTSTAKGTKMPRGDKSAIMKYEVPVFERETQRKIAAILSALDDKIELNRRINANLSAQLETVYRGRFADDMKRGGSLADICRYSAERVAVEELALDRYYSTENMAPEKAGALAAATLPAVANVVKCRTGDVLVSNIRPYFKKILYCQTDCGCSPDVLCFTPQTPELSAFLFATLYADEFFEFMVAGSKGTKMPRGDKKQIMTYPVAIPTVDELNEFNKLATPLLTEIENNRLENIALAAVRDAALPRLMSGEIDVSDVSL